MAKAGPAGERRVASALRAPPATFGMGVPPAKPEPTTAPTNAITVPARTRLWRTRSTGMGRAAASVLMHRTVDRGGVLRKGWRSARLDGPHHGGAHVVVRFDARGQAGGAEQCCRRLGLRFAGLDQQCSFRSEPRGRLRRDPPVDVEAVRSPVQRDAGFVVPRL